jgi:hypothetical protein
MTSDPFCFLWGSRGFGAGDAGSILAKICPSVQGRSVEPAGYRQSKFEPNNMRGSQASPFPDFANLLADGTGGHFGGCCCIIMFCRPSICPIISCIMSMRGLPLAQHGSAVAARSATHAVAAHINRYRPPGLWRPSYRRPSCHAWPTSAAASDGGCKWQLSAVAVSSPCR